jgi:hypothetical protein
LDLPDSGYGPIFESGNKYVSTDPIPLDGMTDKEKKAQYELERDQRGQVYESTLLAKIE